MASKMCWCFRVSLQALELFELLLNHSSVMDLDFYFYPLDRFGFPVLLIGR